VVGRKNDALMALLPATDIELGAVWP